MRLAVTTLPMAALLAACSSSQPPAESATQAAAQESVQVAPAWQAERVKYMECVQVKVDDGVSSKAVPADVAGGALSACQDQLKVMHDAFQSYLMAGMSSAHGRSSAKQAADRVTTDTREKARVYLTRYVEVERYKAGQR
ncbi:hypothetical protein KB891_14050 [Cupriavidus metallidurans]|nr:hypothetical protein [Cupriavidus sp. SHE]KWR87129.1 hypothetical protein RN01_00105 [Cupriavidus sp. SHE]QWC90309.1 hypothetical protein KB891_14050 [Cupriavidus metallidurans]